MQQHDAWVGLVPSHIDMRPMPLLQEGWRLVRPHYFPLLCAFAAFVLVQAPFLKTGSWVVAAFMHVLHTAFISGVIFYLLEAYQGHKVTLATLLEPFKQDAAALIFLFALTGALFFIGICLFVLPGLYVAVLFWFTLPFVLVNRVALPVAVRQARFLLHRQFGEALFLGLALVAVNALGALFGGLGLLLSLPASFGALAILGARVLGLPRISHP